MIKYLYTILLIVLFSCQDNTKPIQQIEETTLKAFPYEEWTILDIQKTLKKGTISSQSLVESYIERIEKVDVGESNLQSVLFLNPDALSIAKKLDKERAEGINRGPLHGIPILLKDNIDTHDKMPCTAGSNALKNSYPLQDSYLVTRLRDAGAIILGKTNLSEWANFRGERSTSGWSAVGGQTKNPYDTTRNPCGSSAGSGVAVSANLCMVAIGTETNGSIVCPANNNGIVGLKPTVGLVSRSGIIPISFTQDTAGPMARTVADAVLTLQAMVGVDSLDSKTLASKDYLNRKYATYLDKDGLKGKRIGIHMPSLGQLSKVDTLFHQAIAIMKTKGAVFVPVESIQSEETNYLSFQVMLHEYKAGLNDYLATLAKDFPIKTIDDIIVFNKTDSIELSFYNQKYLEMAAAKDGLDSNTFKETLSKMLKGSREEGMDRVLEKYDLDAVIAPSGSPAWKTDRTNGDNYLLGSSSPAAQAGYPNISVPMGFVEGLPVGISFFGTAWSEPTLIQIAYAYEQSTKHRKAPKL